MKQPVREPLRASGVDLFSGAGLKELQQPKTIFRITK